MTARIFRSAAICAVVAALLAAMLTAAALFGAYEDDAAQELRNEAEQLLYALSRETDEASFFDGFSSANRVTLIAPDGTVLYDSMQDSSEMGNHLERPEVAQALETGVGESQRRSDTLARNTCYCALRTPKGNVLRLASTRSSMWGVFWQVAPLVLMLFMAVTVLAVSMARSTAERIVAPINELDLDHPMSNDAYDELTPLLRRMERQRNELEWQMQASEKRHQELTANVSHELKTPLTSISGYAEIIRDGMVRPEDVPRFASRIHTEAARMITLVNDLLALSRLDEGSGLGEKAEVDLRQTAQDALDALEKLAQEKGVSLSLEGESSPVQAWPGLLYEMVFNLVDNAVKYTPAGGSVTVRTGGGCVSVSDTGIGIPPQHQQRVFERFYRVDKSHSRATGGTGLGLSIVKHGAMLHGAGVQLESEPGVGTCVRIVFPAKG